MNTKKLTGSPAELLDTLRQAEQVFNVAEIDPLKAFLMVEKMRAVLGIAEGRKAHRFPIGTRYIPLGKNASECTVTDLLTTTNGRGEVVSLRYVATHEFCGQIVTQSDVVDATIARGRITHTPQA